MKKAIFAKKLGMMSIYQGKNALPVTVLQAFKCVVTRKKTKEKEGYNAVVINYGHEAKKMTKPIKCSLKNVSDKPMKYLKELKLSDSVYDTLKIGDELSVSQFEKTKIVTAKGISIGKGFAGVMKRHNFKGLEASHGVSISHRSQGSTGGCQDPGKVFKGKKMAGHLGAETVTVKNLSVVKVDQEKNLIIVKGAVPGAKGGVIMLKSLV